MPEEVQNETMGEEVQNESMAEEVMAEEVQNGITVRENGVCTKGCLDRDGNPHFLLKFFLACPTYVQYEGCDTCAIILTVLMIVPFGQLANGLWVACLWAPPVSENQNRGSVGEPVTAVYGSTERAE